ncbi:MAG TPA: creatininase family protein [Spirochaetia bacterium]|nr:creatininase family protein [Spirochaetia bacterium]
MIEAQRIHGDPRPAVAGRIAILPVGSVEFHGPHGYLGVDSLIADHLAKEITERLDGVLLPNVDYTWCPEMNRPYPGTISVPQRVMEDYFTAVLGGVLSWGVAGVLVICGHNGNVGPLTVAADVVGADHPDQFVLAINWWDTWAEQDSAHAFGFTENGGHGHGGPLEMSAAWAVYPEGVKPADAPDISTAKVRRHPVLRVLHRDGAYPSWNGYHGSISQASIEAGRKLLAHAVERIVSDVESYQKR